MTYPTDVMLEAVALTLYEFFPIESDVGNTPWSLLNNVERGRYFDAAKNAIIAAEQAAWRPLKEAHKDGIPRLYYTSDYGGRMFQDCILPDGQFHKALNSPAITSVRPLPTPPKVGE